MTPQSQPDLRIAQAGSPLLGLARSRGEIAGFEPSVAAVLVELAYADYIWIWDRLAHRRHLRAARANGVGVFRAPEVPDAPSQDALGPQQRRSQCYCDLKITDAGYSLSQSYNLHDCWLQREPDGSRIVHLYFEQYFLPRGHTVVGKRPSNEQVDLTHRARLARYTDRYGIVQIAPDMPTPIIIRVRLASIEQINVSEPQ